MKLFLVNLVIYGCYAEHVSHLIICQIYCQTETFKMSVIFFKLKKNIKPRVRHFKIEIKNEFPPLFLLTLHNWHKHIIN